MYLLTQPIEEVNKEYILQIREDETEHSFLDRVSLLAIDHHPNTVVRLTQNAEPVVYRPEYTIPPLWCKDAHDNDCLALIRSIDGRCYLGNPGEYLVVRLAINTDGRHGPRGPALTIVETYQNLKDGGDGIIIELWQPYQSADGWYELGRIIPRHNPCVQSLELSSGLYRNSSTLTLRLTFLGTHRLDYIGTVTGKLANNYKLQSCRLVSAQHSRYGDILELLSVSDKRYANLSPGEQLTLSFREPEEQIYSSRNFIFISEGYYLQPDDVRLKTSIGRKQSAPPEPYLVQSYPNPCGGQAVIEYFVPPAGQPANIEFYNVLGERLSVISDSYESVPRRIILRTDDNCVDLPTGIYFYRLNTHGITKLRKLVILR